MHAINAFYVRLLQVGFIVLRQAIDARDWEWADRERQFLHNLPSLIDEPNTGRHEYFWIHERAMYLEWIDGRGGEPKSRMLTYYQPTLLEMEPVMAAFLAQPAGAALGNWPADESPATSASS